MRNKRLHYAGLPLFTLSALVIGSASILAVSQTHFEQLQTAQQQEIVRVNVLVTNSFQQPVIDLKQEEFQVLEGDDPQTISYFSKEEPLLLYGIVIDTSNSFKGVLKPVLDAAKLIVNGNRQSDQTFLVRFGGSENVETVHDFTSDKSVLSNSLNDLRILGGQTAIIDALYLSVQYLAKYKKDEAVHHRRAIILFTDGEDRASYYQTNELIKLLRKEDIQVFVIGTIDILTNKRGLMTKSPRQKAEDLLKTFSNETGGITFFVKSPVELQSVAERMLSYMRKQYVVGYSTSAKKRKGGYRKVKVKIIPTQGGDSLTVFARPGYDPTRKN